MCNDGSFVTRAQFQETAEVPPGYTSDGRGGIISTTISPSSDAYRGSVPRTHFAVGRYKRPSVISAAGDRFTPEVSLFIEFDYSDADRARHVLRDVVAEAETRLEEIIDTQTLRGS